MNNETQESVKRLPHYGANQNEHNPLPGKTSTSHHAPSTPAYQIDNLAPPDDGTQNQNGQVNGSNQQVKDKIRDLSTAKTAQSTPVNPNPNASRTIGHYVVGKFFLFHFFKASEFLACLLISIIRALARTRNVRQGAVRHAPDYRREGRNQDSGERQNQRRKRRAARDAGNPHLEDRTSSKRNSAV
jgi:hypothetical protein